MGWVALQSEEQCNTKCKGSEKAQDDQCLPIGTQLPKWRISWGENIFIGKQSIAGKKDQIN